MDSQQEVDSLSLVQAVVAHGVGSVAKSFVVCILTLQRVFGVQTVVINITHPAVRLNQGFHGTPTVVADMRATVRNGGDL